MSYTPTYTFTAGTKARASEVNQNLSDINSANFADKASAGTFSAKQTFSSGTDADISLVPGGAPSSSLAAGDLYVNSTDKHLYIYDGASWQQIGYASEGDITGVTAGDGMTGGGASGDVTLDVVGGTGITANANDIEIDTAVVCDLTTGQTLTNKTLTTPTIGDFSNSGHDHSNVVGGGTIAITDCTGTLLEANGGTGESTYTKGDLLYSDALNSLAKLAIGSSGQILAVSGAGIVEWITNDVGDITEVTAGTGLSGGGTSGAVTVNMDLTADLSFTGDYNFNGGTLGLPTGTSDPGSGDEGDVFYRTDTDVLKVYDGASWNPVGTVQQYLHDQSGSSATWTVTHNLNNLYPIIQCYDSGGGPFEPESISISSANAFVVTLGSATTGKVRVMG